MLFDLRGKRRRLIQTIYVFLALLLGGGLVVFGIGGDAPGGLGDAIGIGQDGGTADPQFDRQIERAEQNLAEDPENRPALLTIARYQYLAGQQELETDDEGFPVVTDDARNRFRAATNAWERYLDTDPREPDDSVATLIFRAYGNVAATERDLRAVQRNFEAAVETAEIIAEAQPGPNTYLQLASYAYMAGNDRVAEEAGRNALAEVEGSPRDQMREALEQAERQGRQLQRELRQASQQEAEQFENPFGGQGVGETGGPGTEPLPSPTP
jgi:hypothetical protein